MEGGGDDGEACVHMRGCGVRELLIWIPRVCHGVRRGVGLGVCTQSFQNSFSLVILSSRA